MRSSCWYRVKRSSLGTRKGHWGLMNCFIGDLKLKGVVWCFALTLFCCPVICVSCFELRDAAVYDCFAGDFSFSCVICNLKSFLNISFKWGWGGVGIACLCTKLTLSWDMWPLFDFEFLRLGCEKMKNHGMCDYIPCIYRNEMMSTSVWIFMMCRLCARWQTKRSVFYEDICGSVQVDKPSIQTVFYEDIVGK